MRPPHEQAFEIPGVEAIGDDRVRIVCAARSAPIGELIVVSEPREDRVFVRQPVVHAPQRLPHAAQPTLQKEEVV